jgi:invasion protein IalB
MSQPMHNVRKAATWFLATALVLIACGGVLSQPAQRPAVPRATPSRPGARTLPPAQGEAPQQTTATYDDWIVQCQTQNGTPPQKLCEMAQVTQVQGKDVPFSRVIILRPEKGQPIKLVVQVPVNASFSANVRIQTSNSEGGMAAPFVRYVPAGCVAEFEIKEDILKKLRAASGAGKLSFSDASGRDVGVPLSFKGFDQAFGALVKD